MKKATQKDIVNTWVAATVYAQQANNKNFSDDTRNACGLAANNLMVEVHEMMKDYCKRTGKDQLDLHKKLANKVFLATRN